MCGKPALRRAAYSQNAQKGKFKHPIKHHLCLTIFDGTSANSAFCITSLNPLTCYAGCLVNPARLSLRNGGLHIETQVCARTRYRTACPDFGISLRDTAVSSTWRRTLILDIQFATSTELLVCLPLLVVRTSWYRIAYIGKPRRIFFSRERIASIL